MTMKIENTALTDSLNYLKRIATDILDTEHKYRVDKRMKDDDDERILRRTESAAQAQFKWNQINTADAKDVVYNQDGNVNKDATLINVNYSNKYKQAGRDNANLYSHSWWLDVQDTPQGVAGIDSTPGQLTRQDLDNDNTAIESIVKGVNEELSDHDIRGLMYYGIFTDIDDELNIAGDTEDIIGELRAAYSDPDLGPKVRDIINRRWKLVSEGIRENKQFKDDDAVINYRLNKLKEAEATVNLMKEQTVIGNAKAVLDNVNVNLNNPAGASLGNIKYTEKDDQGNVTWYDRDGDDMTREKFASEYPIAYDLLTSSDPVRAFTNLYNSLPETNRPEFLKEFQDKSPELFNNIVGAVDDFDVYAAYSRAHDAIISGGIGSTAVDLSVFNDSGTGLKQGYGSLYNNSLKDKSTVDLTNVDIDTKSDELLDLGIPDRYITGNPNVLGAKNDESALIMYKADTINKMFNSEVTSQANEALVHAEQDKGFKENANSVEISLKEIKDSIGPQKWSEYLRWKIDQDDEYINVIKRTNIEPGWSSDQVIRQAKEYSKSLVNVYETHQDRQALKPELENWYSKWIEFSKRANSLSAGVSGVGQGQLWAKNMEDRGFIGDEGGLVVPTVGGDNFFRAYPGMKEEYLALAEEHDNLMTRFTGLDQRIDWNWADYPDLMLKNIRAGAQRGEGMVYQHGGGIVGVPGRWAEETTGQVSGAPWDDTMQTSQIQIPHILGHSRIHPDMFSDPNNSWYVTYFGSDGLEMKATGAGAYNMSGGYVSSHELGASSLAPQYQDQERGLMGAMTIYTGGPSDLSPGIGQRGVPGVEDDVMGSLSLLALEGRPGAGKYDSPPRKKGVGEGGYAGHYAWEDLLHMAETGEGEAAEHAQAVVNAITERRKLQAMYHMGDFEDLESIYTTNELSKLIDDIKKGF